MDWNRFCSICDAKQSGCWIIICFRYRKQCNSGFHRAIRESCDVLCEPVYNSEHMKINSIIHPIREQLWFEFNFCGLREFEHKNWPVVFQINMSVNFVSAAGCSCKRNACPWTLAKRWNTIKLATNGGNFQLCRRTWIGLWYAKKRATKQYEFQTVLK